MGPIDFAALFQLIANLVGESRARAAISACKISRRLKKRLYSQPPQDTISV
jgi:hypothetical protein